MKKFIVFLFFLILENVSFCQSLFSGRYVVYSGAYFIPKNIIPKKDGGLAFTFIDQDHNQTCLVSIDSTGNLLWTIGYQDSLPYQHGHFDLGLIAQTADNGFLLAGGHDSTYSWTGSPLLEYMLIKVDGVGAVQWAKSFSHPGQNSGQKFLSIIPAPDGSFALTTWGLIFKADSLGNIISSSSGAFRNQSIMLSASEYLTVYSNFVLKIDSLIHTVSQFHVQPPNNVTLGITNVLESVDHNYAFAGMEDSASNLAVSFFRTDTAGNILSAFHTPFPSVSGTYDIFPISLLQLADSEYVLIVAMATGGTASWRIFKFDASGQPTESNEMSFNSYFAAHTSATTCLDKNKYAVLLQQQLPWGSTYASVMLIDNNDSSWCGLQPVPETWLSDSLTVIHDPPFQPGPWPVTQATLPIITTIFNQTRDLLCYPFASIDHEMSAAEDLFLYPVPTTGKLFFRNGNWHSGEIKFFDVMGRLLISKIVESGKNETAHDISGFQNGIYLLYAIVDGKIYTQKIIKQ